MTVEYEGLPLWEVEIQALRPVTATAFIAASNADAARRAARTMDVSYLYFQEAYGRTVHLPGNVRPAQTYDEPDIIVREGAT